MINTPYNEDVYPWHKDKTGGDLAVLFTLRDHPTALYVKASDKKNAQAKAGKNDTISGSEINYGLPFEKGKFACFWQKNYEDSERGEDNDNASLFHKTPSKHDRKFRFICAFDFKVSYIY